MHIRHPLSGLIALAGVLSLCLAGTAGAGQLGGDQSLFSASGGAPPNILILLDSSGSMGKAPAAVGCDAKKDPNCPRKRDMANRAIFKLVTTVNPSDGKGGYINNARFGFAIFTHDGARLLVPVGDNTVGDIVTWTTNPDIPTAADVINKMGGNSHGLAMMEMARYFAHKETFGPFPPFGFSDPSYSGLPYTGTADPTQFAFEDPNLPSVWDLACRPSFMVHIDDGLWGGDDGARFGACSDLNGDGVSETCALEFIGDTSGDGTFWMEDISKKMFEHDFASNLDGLQNVVIYVIGFDEPKAVDLMRTTAELGGGAFYFAANEQDLTDALFNITVNIFESLASFAGAAVPAARSTSGSALYNAWFEPKNNESIWAGHLEAWGLAANGEILDQTGASATDPNTGLLLEPRNPYWDAGNVIKTTSRTIFTTNPQGTRVSLDTTNVSVDDLALASGGGGTTPPPPPPSSGVCDPVAASVPAGWDFQLIAPSSLPDIAPDGKVTFRYCVGPERKDKKKDFFGVYPINGTGTDAINLKERKKKDAICKYDGNGNVIGGWKEKKLKVGKTEQLVQVRYYLSNDFSPGGLAGFSDSICVTTSGAGSGGTPPPPPPVSNPDFAPYPNSQTSGIDTYPELQTAVIDYAYGKDAFDENGDGSFTDTRTVVLGDIFHSTPLVIGQPTKPLALDQGFAAFRDQYNQRDRIVYVGANDGMLHAFHAGNFHADNPATTAVNEGDDPNTPEIENGYYDQGTGTELFGYVPGLLLDKLKFLSHNIPRTTYFVDAPPIAADAWLGDGSGTDITKSSSEWATVLITGFREGGPGYLALDVSDPSAGVGAPHGPYPKLLWEFTHAKLGEAWSEAVITRVKLRGPTATGDHCGHDDGDGDCLEKWVAIFGGGYEATADPNHFTFVGDPTSPGWSDRSKAIFMVDVLTGEIIATTEFDATGVNGPSEMKFSLPGRPAVLDIDADGFADTVYIGDLGGQMWKWDVSAVGADIDADPEIDTWPVGVFFRSDPVTLGNGTLHYRSIYNPPSATFVHGVLTLAFGTGEREELRYAGEAGVDDENRFYVVKDAAPTGSSAFNAVITEADMINSDVTNLSTDPDLNDAGFFFKTESGEKFVTDVTIFAGNVIVASYTPTQGADICTTAGGQAFLHVFGVDSSVGFFGDVNTPPDPRNDRRLMIGGGLPSNPRVSVAQDPTDDKIYIKTSTGQVIAIQPPPRNDPGRSVIYWRQLY